MDNTITLGQATAGIFHFAGQAAFQWMPALYSTIFTTGTDSFQAVANVSSPMTVSDAANFLQAAAAPGAYDAFTLYWNDYIIFATVLSLLCGALLIYCIVRMGQIRENEEARFAASAHTISANDVPRTQLRWIRIMEEINSESEQHWRLAILEADIMLNELLDTLGYRGETMGEKMRSVERGDFNTIDLAWEAHRARNRIAHEGSDLLLNGRDARRIIGLYERVFREFRFIE